MVVFGKYRFFISDGIEEAGSLEKRDVKHSVTSKIFSGKVNKLYVFKKSMSK